MTSFEKGPQSDEIKAVFAIDVVHLEAVLDLLIESASLNAVEPHYKLTEVNDAIFGPHIEEHEYCAYKGVSLDMKDGRHKF